jgi:hypothetical protein
LLVRLYELGNPTALINVAHLSLPLESFIDDMSKIPTIAIFVKLINGFYTYMEACFCAYSRHYPVMVEHTFSYPN